MKDIRKERNGGRKEREKERKNGRKKGRKQRNQEITKTKTPIFGTPGAWPPAGQSHEILFLLFLK